MEYERTENDQIQAAFATRVGKVLLHYEGAGREGATGERYEATLCSLAGGRLGGATAQLAHNQVQRLSGRIALVLGAGRTPATP